MALPIPNPSFSSLKTSGEYFAAIGNTGYCAIHNENQRNLSNDLSCIESSQKDCEKSTHLRSPIYLTSLDQVLIQTPFLGGYF